ncbi:MAG: response regulator [bacterium]|nr:response regulator [bacterium]
MKKSFFSTIVDAVLQWNAVNVSYCSGISLLVAFASWFAAIYGYFFIHGNTLFSDRELTLFLTHLVAALILATLGSHIHLGALHRFGFPHPKHSKMIAVINQLLSGERTETRVEKLDSGQQEELLGLLLKFPSHNSFLVGIYSMAVVLLVTVTNIFYADSLIQSVVILIGGLIATGISSYYALEITEHLVAPTRRHVMECLFRKNIAFEKKSHSSFKKIFYFGLFLVVLTLVLLTQSLIAGSQSWWEITFFVAQSITTIAFILYSFLHSITRFLDELQGATRNLSEGGAGLLFPSLSYKELVGTAVNYNSAAREINAIRKNLESVIEERTRHLVTARKQAEAANEARNQFLANMSHEIGTPVNGIVGLIDLLLSSDISPQQSEQLQLVKRSSLSLLDIITGILELSRVQAGKLKANSAVFHLEDLLKSVMDVLAIAVSSEGLIMAYQIESGVPQTIKGDSALLRQVLVHLTANAVKFTHKGRIDISVDVKETATHRCSLRFTISDTGIGIPGDKLKSIFTSFTQADGSVTRQYGGTGVGLTIAQEMICLMGGNTIDVTSTVGKGSRFSFTLSFPIPADETRTESPAKSPCRKNKKTTATVPVDTDGPGPEESDQTISPPVPCEPPVPLAPPQLRILLAEDHDINRKLIVSLIRKKGWQVQAVQNGKEALAILVDDNCRLKEHFDLILMDGQMPVMGGIEATRILRSCKSFDDTPIIAITAHTLKGDRERFIEAGMNDYLSKPINDKQFYQVIEKHTTKAQ